MKPTDMKIANPMYIQQPACCVFCTAARHLSGGFLIDTGKVHPHVGTMYICDLCRELLVATDDQFVERSEVEDQLQEVRVLRMRHEEALDHLTGLKEYMQIRLDEATEKEAT